MALTKLADAENKYFAEHKTFTNDLHVLRLALKPEVNISILKADEQSFIASASHKSCDKDNDGKPDVLMWDSARGGLQCIGYREWKGELMSLSTVTVLVSENLIS